MATLFRYETAGLEHEPFLLQGDEITVDGAPMVRLRHGTIVPADGYCTSIAAAKLNLAERLDAMAQKVLGRIAALLKETMEE